MEKFKKSLKRRVNVLCIILLLTSSTYIALSTNDNILPQLPPFVEGFHIGVFIGGVLILVYYIAKFMSVINDEKNLRKMYIKENDERGHLIAYKTSQFTLVGTIILLGMGTIISGFFNTTVFFTLLSCLALFLVIIIIARIYNDKNN
ncbi:hypothetical protein [Dethiothermospora halolimnae]|uniref:hypothetical protein n=1 Tax=Dethiothermospora halolimnae TaxID=3114390 RepID=UPI003CCC2696